MTKKAKKNYAVFVISADGSVTKTIQPKKPEYQQLRNAVLGLIETVPYFTSFEYGGKKYNRGTAYVNEEGLIIGLAKNTAANAAWRKAVPKGDPDRMQLVGPVIFYATTDEII